MTYRYISDVTGGTLRLLRMLPGNLRKAAYRRNDALSPGAHGKPRWGFPTTWLMGHRAGYWQSIDIPKMEGRISKSARKAVWRQPAKPLRAAGEGHPPDLVNGKTAPVNDKTPPIRLECRSALAKYNVPLATAIGRLKEVGPSVGVTPRGKGAEIPNLRVRWASAKSLNYAASVRRSE